MADDSDARKARTAATFGALATDYDRGPGCSAHFGRRLVDFAAVKSGHRVLDVATGRGAVLFPAAERAGVTGEVLGTDFAHGMVDAVNAEASRKGLPDVRTIVMDAEALDFPEGTFDRVLCGFGIMFLPHLQDALRGFGRLLRADGLLGVSTWHVSQADDLVTVLGDLHLADAADALPLRLPDELASALAAAGFKDVQVQPDTATFRYADLADYWHAARGTGMRPRLDRLDAGQTALVRQALADRLRDGVRSDGLYVTATALLASARPGRTMSTAQ
ncbi:MAG: class I SAM-dependent methyltransferase [Chloroflexota bacterium]